MPCSNIQLSMLLTFLVGLITLILWTLYNFLWLYGMWIVNETMVFSLYAELFKGVNSERGPR